MVTTYIGLGSNLNNPVQQVTQAISALSQLDSLSLNNVSSLYQGPPMGPTDQPDYVNAVAEIATALTPDELLEVLQRIENVHGRVRSSQHWGARTLDLDILLYGDKTIKTDVLTIPHSGLYERAFVLYPLKEIASSELSIPGYGTLGQLLANCQQGSLEVLPGSDFSTSTKNKN
jgi:2-amino-4-hydroxy-6-hydroxymethyldihydropteridine diphosphokinase